MSVRDWPHGIGGVNIRNATGALFRMTSTLVYGETMNVFVWEVLWLVLKQSLTTGNIFCQADWVTAKVRLLLGMSLLGTQARKRGLGSAESMKP